MSVSDDTNTRLSSSTGHDFSTSKHIDAHFASAQQSYREAFEFADIRTGWRVLDAGCGSGAFLPWIADAVGAKGSIEAIDLAPENVELAQQISNELQCDANVRQGAISQLPYSDREFDAVWCANVTQYLTDEELREALSEFCRVVKPGGTIAIKDHDITLWTMRPLDPLLWARLWERIVMTKATQMFGVLRVANLDAHMRRAGVHQIKAKTTITDYRAPLEEPARTMLRGIAQYFGNAAIQVGVSPEDMEVWRKLADIDSPDHVMLLSDFYCREGDCTFVGKV